MWLGDRAYRNGAEALAKLIVDTADAAAKVALARLSYLIKQFTEQWTSLHQTPFARRDGSTVQPGTPQNDQ